MTLIDQNQKAYATKTVSYSNSGGDDAIFGNIGNVTDHDNATYFEYYAHHGGDGSIDVNVDFQSQWLKPQKIYQVYANGTAQMDGGNYFTDRGSEFDFTVYLKISGSWVAIASSGSIFNGKAGDGASPYNYISNLTTGWSEVTACRFRIHAYVSSYEGNRQQFAWLYLNELQCYREKLIEVVRLEKADSTLLKVGRQELQTTHKLRIAKASTTYGIPLVDLDDPVASQVRIFDGNNVKALPIVD